MIVKFISSENNPKYMFNLYKKQNHELSNLNQIKYNIKLNENLYNINNQSLTKPSFYSNRDITDFFKYDKNNTTFSNQDNTPKLNNFEFEYKPNNPVKQSYAFKIYI